MIMRPVLKRILRTIVYTILLSALIAYHITTRNNFSSWDQVLTAKFWIFAVLNIIPSYFIVQIDEGADEISWSQRQVMLMIIAIIWALIIGIACAISHFVFNYKLF